MWDRRAAIRPVPVFAQVPERILERVEDELADDGEDAEKDVDGAFENFETAQPVLSSRIQEAMARLNDETAIALGYFLSLSTWMAFERTFPGDLHGIDELAVAGVEQALSLDEEIRIADPAEVIDSDDVIAMEQPHVLKFVQEHIDAALEANSDEVDVDEVHAIYRSILIQVLALSYAVKPPKNYTSGDTQEFSA